MRFSIWPSQSQPWDDVHEIAAHCERTGWDGVYFADHFMPNDPGQAPADGDVLECWSVIAALAASVPRIRLASLVTSVTYRHPAVLAKMAATVDQISCGRLTLGVGVGWQENEHTAYGLPLGTIRERMDRFEEAVQILHSLLGRPRSTFSGQYFQVREAPCQPAPVQNPLPLLIGGDGERRTLRIAARYGNQWNCWATPEGLAHKISVLKMHCDQACRDPAEIQISTQALLFLATDQQWLHEKRAGQYRWPTIIGTPGEVREVVARYQEAGADEMIVRDSTLGPMSQKKDTCDLFIEEIAPALR